jgi:hypothetical protein
VKRGCRNELIELVKAERAKDDNLNHRIYNHRIYTSHIGPGDLLVQEFEFENLGELEKSWAEWFADPETTEFRQKWSELVEHWVSTEVWHLIE